MCPIQRRLKIGMLAAVLASGALSGPLSLPIARAQNAPGNITTWSVQVNTPDWNKNLGVTATRQGCSSSPTDCVNLVRKVSQTSNNVRATLAVPLNTTTTARDALQFSQLSLNAPFLVEVGIDDFVAQYKALFPSSNPSPDPATLLNTIIANLKSVNPALKFGATIYEDELTSPYLQDARLPSATRDQFDYVHLFIHYREAGPSFEQYVQQAKQVFPNALIIAGSYAVDRRAFLPCAPQGQPCTTAQERDLFSQSLTIQAKLLASKAVDSIEFFPGYFGNEDQWPGLSNPRECAAGDQANCIANTKAMRQAALTILGSGSPPSGGGGFFEALSTFAGNGGGGYSGDNGAATSAQISAPSGAAADRAGNVYVVDTSNYVVRKIDTAGTIYIADSGSNTIRTVDHGGIIHTLAGNGAADYTGDGGPAKAAALSSPEGVAVDRAGNVYIADFGNNVVRRVDKSGTIRTFAGSGTAGYAGDEGPAAAAQLLAPEGVAVDNYGAVYIADTGNNVIRNVDGNQVIHTFAGNGTGDFGGDGGPAAAGELAQPGGLAEYDTYPHPCVADVQIYVADTVNNRVRRIYRPPVHVAP
jgi:NHL repeat